MSYIGAEPTTAAFPFDQFSGNGTTTAFTLTYAPASTTSIIVAISGVVQNPNLYSVIGTTITFSPAPPTGTNNISVLYLGLPVIGVSNPGNTAYFSSTSFTATGGQTTFTPSGSYTPGFINVIRNGAQLAPANYTATNGTTVTLANACTAGDIVVIEVYTLTSLTNALPLTGGTVTGASTFNVGVNLAVSSGNVGIGTSSPSSGAIVKFLQVDNATSAGAVFNAVRKYSIYSSASSTLVFYDETGAAVRAVIDSSGNFLVTSVAGLGYGTGAGGTVTQATSKSTAVTLNRPTGQITMNGAALAANTSVVFQLNNTVIGSADTVIVNAVNSMSLGVYMVCAEFVQPGSCYIHFRNVSGGSLSQAVILNFSVIKGAIS